MDIAREKAELTDRQQKVLAELNQVISQINLLSKRKAEVITEIERLNGEGRMLNRLSDNGKPSPGK